MEKVERQATVARIFSHQHERLEAFLRVRLANDDDAAELAQEAFLRLLRVKRPDLIRNPQGYLYRIARNLVHELYTRQRIRYDAKIDLDLLESQEPTPHDQAVLAGRREWVEKTMRELPPKCQAALLLRWREGLTQAEIGERLQVSRQMVQKYLAAGIAHCRKRLRQIASEQEGLW